MIGNPEFYGRLIIYHESQKLVVKLIIGKPEYQSDSE